MRKVTKYFLIVVAIFLATCLVIGIFYIRLAYRALIANESNFPPLISGIINKISRQKPAPAPALRDEDTIKILEGWTNSDINDYFVQSGRWESDSFLDVAGHPRVDYRNNKKYPELKDFSGKFVFLDDKPKYFGLEGYLFPDTYRIYASSSAEEVVVKMLENFDNKLTPKMRADIKAQGRTIYSIITLASIVEKEAPIDNQSGDNRDARIIAGIFLNRLRSGQGLQSDATLSYIYNDNKPTHSGAELEVNSPYNTYKYRGLPPGPICNPGIVAIEAAIYPIATDYNYFLTPKGKEEVIYSRTYDEHLQNKYKYLK